ncbi:MAG: hypothetical protein KY397_02155 [Gemmatimonadetes bacterium]|nr:hypothetical protein [Gemmatimonadota bacterium]
MKRGGFVAAAILTVAVAISCDRGEDGGIEIGDDTLRTEVPEDAAERLERTGRAVGGAVGEALEETGQAIEAAGERIQEEAGDTLDS